MSSDGRNGKGLKRRDMLLSGTSLIAASAIVQTGLTSSAPAQQPAPAQPTGNRPNILFIMGDDIGWFNVSAYNMGIMGYRTPNIDRIGKEGAVFTDWYGQQSCTAGRAAFITGQSPIRTGLTKVGLPGATLGLGPDDPSIADVMKTYGYATGQFGKNHLGDRNEHLPTVHGFDEFFGNLYHLNAEEEPENPDYPKNPAFRQKFGPRGVLHTWATDTEDPTVDPQFGKVGKQRIENTGPLTTKRMETIDDEFTNAAMDWMDKQAKAGKPFFCYYNSTRMHVFTHLKKESQGKTGLGIYPDGMVEHDGHVGQLLKKLDDLGVADNTVVVYTTDNGAEVFTWPDGGTTPFKGEKATNWEGGFRVPCLIRWPGVVKPGSIVNDIYAHQDFIPTFAAATGETDLVEKLKKGSALNGKNFKVHLDGYNLLPFLKGRVKGFAARRFPVLERRRRFGSLTGSRLEDLLYGAEYPAQPANSARGLAGPIHQAAGAHHIQSAHRSVRAGSRKHRLRRLGGASRLPAGAGAGRRRGISGKLQGVPAAR
jgi:arylsulfatase A-like enzyme